MACFLPNSLPLSLLGRPMATASLPHGPLDSNDDVSEIDRVVEQIDALRPLAFNLAFRLLRRTEDAADAVQDASILAVRAVLGTTATPREPAHFKAWFLRIVTNAALTQLRRKRPGGSVSLDELEGDLPDSRAEQPLSVVERRERRGDVLAALLALPDAQRAALTLREYQGLTYDEIGETLGMNRGSTTALLYRARTSFRTAYEGVAARRRPVRCVQLAPLISAMLDDELEAATWTRVDSHIAACPHCTRELRMLRRSQRLHSIVPLLTPPAAWTTASTLGAQRTAEIIDLTTRVPAAVGPIDRAAEVGRPLAAGALLGATAFLPNGTPGNVVSLVERGLGKLAAVVTAAGLLLVVASGNPTPSHDAGPSADEDAANSMAATSFPAASAVIEQAAIPPSLVIAQAAPATPEVVGEHVAPQIAASGIGSIVQAAAPSASSPETVAQAPRPASDGPAQGSEPPDQSGGAVTGDPPVDRAPARQARDTQARREAPPPRHFRRTRRARAHRRSICRPSSRRASTCRPLTWLSAGFPLSTCLRRCAGRRSATHRPPDHRRGRDRRHRSICRRVDVPAVDVPPVSLPVAGLPPIDVPPIDVPAIDLPAVEVPAVQVPLAEIPLVEGTLDRTQGVAGPACTGRQTVQGVGQTGQQVGESTAPLISLGDNLHGTLEEASGKSIDSKAAATAHADGQPATPPDVSATAGAPAANGAAPVEPRVNASAGPSTSQPNSSASASVRTGTDTNSVTTSVNAGTGRRRDYHERRDRAVRHRRRERPDNGRQQRNTVQSASEHDNAGAPTVTVNANLDSGGSGANSSSSSAATSVSASVDTGSGSAGSTDTSSGKASV